MLILQSATLLSPLMVLIFVYFLGFLHTVISSVRTVSCLLVCMPFLFLIVLATTFDVVLNASGKSRHS